MSDRTDQFKIELAALCKKYRCFIIADDHYLGYPEYGEDVRMTVEFEDDYTADPPLPYEDLDLGQWFDGKEQEGK